MAKCKKCGVEIPRGKKFCIRCGAPVVSSDGGPSHQGTSHAVMSTGAFIVASLVMCIPVVGLIIYIVWACGGCKNLNRRNLARATLILLVIGLVLSLGFYFLMGSVVGSSLGGIQDLLDSFR